MIYLKELIILIDVDAQKHIKDCKKKDNPRDCPSHQFYAKSKYYVAQIIESISDENEPAKSKHQLNNNLSKETLSVIEDLFNGGKHPLTKDSPEEISEIINRLKNLGFLYKASKHSYALHHKNRIYIAKLIELKSWNEFNNWLTTKKEEAPTTSNVTNNFQNSSIGQFNQASGKSLISKPKNITKESSKISPLNKLFWILGILVSLIALYEFVIKHIIK